MLSDAGFDFPFLMLSPFPVRWLQEFGELLGGDPTIAKDLVEEAGADDFTRVNGYNGIPSVRVVQEMNEFGAG